MYYPFLIVILLNLPVKRVHSLLFCILGLLAGHGYLSWHLSDARSSTPHLDLPTQLVRIQAYACSLPKSNEYAVNVVVCLCNPGIQSLKSMGTDSSASEGDPFRINQSWEMISGQRLKMSVPHAIWNVHKDRLTGDSFTASARIRPVHGLVNPIGFDFEKYLFSEKVKAIGTMRSLENEAVVCGNKIRKAFHQLRYQLRQHLEWYIGGRQSKPLLVALAMGDRSFIGPELNDLLTQSNIVHLVAISGLHVGIVVTFIYACLVRAGAPSTIVLIMSLSAGLAYVFLSGMGVPALRAWVMAAGVCWYKVNRQGRSPWTFFWLAMCVCLLIHPLSILSVGFVLSFLAAAVLISARNWLVQYRGSSMTQLLGIQILIALVFWPMSIIQTDQLSFHGFLSNLLAIPLVSLIALPLTLLGSVLTGLNHELAAFAFNIADWTLIYLVNWLSALSDVELLKIKTLAPAGWELLLWIGLLLLLYNVSSLKSVRILVIFTVAFTLICGANARRNEEGFLLFDSGQGLAMMMLADGKIWQYDLGPAYDSLSIAANYVVPYTKSIGHRRAEGLILSHGDIDHAGDFGIYLKQIKAKTKLSGEPKRLNVGFDQCREGLLYQSPQFSLEVLYVAQRTPHLSANNHSCVVRAQWSDFSVLIMGDLEAEQEKEFVRRYRHRLQSDVLIAGHHGSRHATSMALLKHVQPRKVLISAGYRNRFNHPHADVVDRVSRWGAEMINTADSGYIHLQVFEDGTKVWNRGRNLSSPIWRQKSQQVGYLKE